MQVQVPLLADPITRTIFSYPPDAVVSVDSIQGTTEVEFDLPEGVHEAEVSVAVVGVGNNGRPVGEPEVIKYGGIVYHDSQGPDGVEGVEGSDEQVATSGFVQEVKEPATDEVKVADNVEVTVERADEGISQPELSLDSQLHLGDHRDIVSPFQGSGEVTKHDGPYRGGPAAMGL